MADEAAAEPEPEPEPAPEDAEREAEPLVPTPPKTPRSNQIAPEPGGSDPPKKPGWGALRAAMAAGSKLAKLVKESESEEEEELSEAQLVEIMKENQKHMKKVNLLRNVPFCAHLPEETLLQMAKVMDRVTVVRGEDVIREGEDGDAMYIVEQGELDVHISTAGKVRTYTKADFFGEICVLESGQKRAATITATSAAATCLKLDRKDVGLILAPLKFAAQKASGSYRFQDPLRGKKRKVVLYAIFLAIFVVVSFGARPADLYHQNALVETSFELEAVEEDVSTWESAYEYLEGNLLPAIYKEEHQPGSGYPLQLVTGFQLRQVRVSKEHRHDSWFATAGKCDASQGKRPRARFHHVGHLQRGPEVIAAETEELAHHWGGCSEPFHPIAEEVEEPFGTGRRQWTYSAADDLLGRDVGSLPGKFGTYPAGGYVAIPRPASTQEPAQSTCCEAEGTCEGNTDASLDVVCSNSWEVNRGSGARGSTEAACCTPYTCTGNAASAQDVTCSAGTALKAGSAAVARSTADGQADCCETDCSSFAGTCAAGSHKRTGADATSTAQGADAAASCCVADVAGRCEGNTASVNDVQCTGSFKLNRGVGVSGDSEAACCVDQMCSHNGDSTLDVTCAAGKGLKAGSGSIARTTSDGEADCCEDLADRCAGNAAGADVDCPAHQYNLGSSVAGTDAGACCAALKCSGNPGGVSDDYTCGAGLTLRPDSGSIVRTGADSDAECCAQSCTGWQSGGCLGGSMSAAATCAGPIVATTTLTPEAACSAWCVATSSAQGNEGLGCCEMDGSVCALHAGTQLGAAGTNSSCVLEATAAPDGTYACDAGSHLRPAADATLSAWPRGGEPAVAPSTLDEALEVMEELKSGDFIDRFTRAVIVDWTVADTQLGLLSANKVLLEFSTQGRVVGSFSTKTVRHVPMFDKDSKQAWWEAIMSGMVVLYLVDEVKDLVVYLVRKSRAEAARAAIQMAAALGGDNPVAHMHVDIIPESENYLADPWNIIDVLNYILFVLVIFSELLSRYDMNRATDMVNEGYLEHMHIPIPPEGSTVQDSSCAALGMDEAACADQGCFMLAEGCTAAKPLPAEEFFALSVNFYGAAYDSCFAFTMLGVNSIVTWLKLLKYLNAFPHLAMMSKTVGNAMFPTLSFMIMFFIFFFGCAQGFVMVFGGNLEGYQGIGASMMSLFRALIGDFDVEAMIKVDRVIGPILFMMFIIIGMLFLLNVFIAILSEAYEKAKIQVFGDAFDEREEQWEGAPTFVEYFDEFIMAELNRVVRKATCRGSSDENIPTVAPWILHRMRAWATGAVQRVEAGDRTLNEDTQAFSLTTHIKAIERWMKADDQRMQQAIKDLNSMMKQLSAQLGGTSGGELPPVKVPPHLEEPAA